MVVLPGCEVHCVHVMLNHQTTVLNPACCTQVFGWTGASDACPQRLFSGPEVLVM